MKESKLFPGEMISETENKWLKLFYSIVKETIFFEEDYIILSTISKF